MSPRRLLLCRPAGGLNDMLCQIERACRYADRFGRTVIVETDHQGAIEFRDRFADYFVSRQRRLVLSAERVRHRFDAMEVFPSFLRGRVTSYRPRNTGREGRTVDEATGLRVSFDFERDYDQPLLVHHDFGGGRHSLDALRRLRIGDAVAAELRRRRGSIGGSYAALHIRNTDYRARYRDRLDELAQRLSGPIFVATDNRASLDDCRQAFGAARVISFANLSHPAGQPLHHLGPEADARERNLDAVVDLLMLALADSVHGFELEPNPVGAKVSGFTSLAIDLHEAPAVLRRLAPQAFARPPLERWRQARRG